MLLQKQELDILNDGPLTKFLLRRKGSARQAALRNRNASLQRNDIIAQNNVIPEEASKLQKKRKSQTCFSPVLPESLSEGTRSNYWTKIK